MKSQVPAHMDVRVKVVHTVLNMALCRLAWYPKLVKMIVSVEADNLPFNSWMKDQMMALLHA